MSTTCRNWCRAPRRAAAQCGLPVALALVAVGLVAPAVANEGYPQLRPLSELLDRQSGAVLQPDGAAGLAARAARLATRAAALRTRATIEPETRARITGLAARAAALQARTSDG